MILKLAYYGDPILRKKADLVKIIDESIHQLVNDMSETLGTTKNGVGLAAPQVNVSKAVFIVQFPDPAFTDRWVPGPIEVFINPKILEVSEEGWSYSEGCLSIPNIYENVYRPIKIKIQAQNLAGDIFVKEYAGYPARMVLHENDHLNGVLFIDRIDKKRRNIIEAELKKIKKELSNSGKD